MLNVRQKRSLDIEFSRNWTCQANARNETSTCDGQTCQNGNCTSILSPIGPVYTCTCDEGWQGRFCDKCCDLPCENGGVCIIDHEENLPHCSCTKGYAGVLCEDQDESGSGIIGTPDGGECQASKRAVHSPCPEETTECINGECVDHLDPTLNLPTSKCDCDPGWTGLYCDVCECNLQCSEGGGFCQIHPINQTEFCNCFKGFSGPRCAIKVTEAPNIVTPPTERFETATQSTSHTVSTAWILPLVLSLAVLLIAILVVMYILYKKYRKRNLWLVKQSTKYHCRNLNDSYKRYDIFLSYQGSNNNDKQFAELRLIPFLKSKGYTVCVSSLEASSGAAFESLEEAWMSSKRTIALLSDDYVEHEWLKIEAICTKRQIVRTDYRIIPVINGKIKCEPGRLSKLLESIIHSVSCVVWAEGTDKQIERFWKGLLVRLPNPTIQHGSGNVNNMLSKRQTSHENLILYENMISLGVLTSLQADSLRPSSRNGLGHTDHLVNNHAYQTSTTIPESSEESIKETNMHAMRLNLNVNPIRDGDSLNNDDYMALKSVC